MLPFTAKSRRPSVHAGIESEGTNPLHLVAPVARQRAALEREAPRGHEPGGLVDRVTAAIGRGDVEVTASRAARGDLEELRERSNPISRAERDALVLHRAPAQRERDALLAVVDDVGPCGA